MQLVLGECNSNSADAVRRYREKHSNQKVPNHHTVFSVGHRFWEVGMFHRMWRDVGFLCSVRNEWVEEQILEVIWKRVSHHYQTSRGPYRSITCFSALCITRKVVVSLSHSGCVRNGTALGICRMRTLSVDSAPVGQRPYVYSKCLCMDRSCLSRTWMTNIHNDHVARWKSCN
jgi:hypothetical protein